MRLYNPEGYIYAGSYAGWSDYKSVTLENPQSGTWSLYVYPFNVKEKVNVSGLLNLKSLVNWDWFSYDYNNNQLEIKSNTNDSGIYAGKLFLKDNWNLTYTMIPTSIILSEKVDFKNKIIHSNKISPCSSDGPGGYSGWGSSDNSQESYANFDGYFCNDLQRRAYSFNIPNNIPEFYISANWWNPESYDYGDIRMFLYDPYGELYSSVDYDGNYESIYVLFPNPGNWTVVFQAEYLPEDGIIFSGEAIIPNLIFDKYLLYL